MAENDSYGDPQTTDRYASGRRHVGQSSPRPRIMSDSRTARMTSSVADPSRLRGLLEPLAGKLAWAVLRGRGRSNAPALPDR